MYSILRMRSLWNIDKMAANFIEENMDFNDKIQKNCGPAMWELTGIAFIVVKNSKLCKKFSVLRGDQWK